ncbi:PREDICTED: C-type lectin domain family 4 member K [Chinchilla lanigera]|uniref:CD207 molecule n=1 Tax=Chinchilla lanigera TaxID=34839 RepID=A0A8C2VDY5_CHILA|nr:PREDICTED: C-type lectin domain family 4 member K [Chinchilla lanigera]
MKAAEKEAHDAHFCVDKQNIALWPREPPPKQDPSLGLQKSLAIRVGLICLSLVVVTSIVLQAILYPWLMGTVSNVKTSAELLKGRVDNISTLGSEIKKNSGGVKAASVQIQTVNASLDSVHSQILMLKTSVEKAKAQIQSLRKKWEEVDHLNTQIPELKKDMDKASALNGMVRALQGRMDNINKLLRQQSDILQMVSQGWKFFKENFYYFSRTPKTWYSAEQFCVSRNSRLTSVTSQNEQEFLYKTAGGVQSWIGLTKAGSEGGWYWVDNTPFNKGSVSFWLPGEPNNVGNSEHCVNIKVSSLQSWNDDSCDIKLYFICKQPYVQSEP